MIDQCLLEGPVRDAELIDAALIVDGKAYTQMLAHIVLVAAVDALHQRLGAAAVEGLTSNTAGSLTYTA